MWWRFAVCLFKIGHHCTNAKILHIMAEAKLKTAARAPKTETAEAATLSAARRVLTAEQQGLEALARQLDARFVAAVQCLRRCRGRVIVSGMGKSGHIAHKIAASFASTGMPAHFVHPAEAGHGDLGMIASDDVVLALSWSGETPELRHLTIYAKRFAIPLIAMTSAPDSALAESADHVLLLPPMPEACPNGLAPTTSTTMQLALGDALAICLLESRGFSREDFRTYHPSGKLGASLRPARSIMHRGEALPLVPKTAPMSQALIVMSQKGLGTLGVVDAQGHLCGIITDGDLRRHMNPDLLQSRAQDVMTANPKTISAQMMASAALHLMTEAKIQALFVTEQKRPVGFIHLHDLLRIGVV